MKAKPARRETIAQARQGLNPCLNWLEMNADLLAALFHWRRVEAVGAGLIGYDLTEFPCC